MALKRTLTVIEKGDWPCEQWLRNRHFISRRSSSDLMIQNRFRWADCLILRWSHYHYSLCHWSVPYGHQCCNNPGLLWWTRPCKTLTSACPSEWNHCQTVCDTESSIFSKLPAPKEGTVGVSHFTRRYFILLTGSKTDPWIRMICIYGRSAGRIKA